MAINSSVQVFIITCLILLSARCDKNCYKEVHFQLPITIYPEKEIYHIGDTIWIEIKIPYYLRDKISNEDILVGPYPFKISMNIIEIMEDSWKDAFDSFQFVESVGKIDTFGLTYQRIEPIFQDFTAEKYQLNKFGIIPSKSALAYLLIFSKVNYNGDWSGVKQFPHDDCDYAIDNSTYLTNDGNIDYRYYLNTYPHTHNPGSGADTISNLRNAGAFFLKVE